MKTKENKFMPSLYMMVGIPGSGKSTYVQDFIGSLARVDNLYIASTDNLIEYWAQDVGKTYDEIFQKYIVKATETMFRQVRYANIAKKDIYWDQTNLTVKTRAKKLSLFPEGVNKYAVIFPTPPIDVLKQRLDSRPGKNIPWDVVEFMMSQYEEPTEDEGFDNIFRGNVA